jgi:glucose-6-phosphate dehydrogenase assembly protein OpcA
VVLSHTDQPDRTLPLPRRELGDLLAEELQRLDSDETYAEALSATTGVDDLATVAVVRTHVWVDPAEQHVESVLVEGLPREGEQR